MTATTPLKRCYSRKPYAFSAAYLETLRQEILNSPYLASSQLSDGFIGTQGFSVVFKRSGIAIVEQQFPYLKLYLDKALKSACNAFYLNPLVLEGNSQVNPHVDCSLSSYEMQWMHPQLVSVLYVSVPADLQGGQLVLQDREEHTWQIEPEQNTLLYFLGWVLHSVTPTHTSSKRISLVCEQYHLSDDRLAKIPDFEIKSGNGHVYSEQP
jgi:hypothetical protein